MKYDWQRWRDAFVMTDSTLKEISEQPGAPAHISLKRKSSAEDWPKQRRLYRDQANARTRERASVEEAEIGARHVRIAKSLQAKALAALQRIDPDDLNPREIVRYLKDAAEIERKALGLDDREHHGGAVEVRIVRE